MSVAKKVFVTSSLLMGSCAAESQSANLRGEEVRKLEEKRQLKEKWSKMTFAEKFDMLHPDLQALQMKEFQRDMGHEYIWNPELYDNEDGVFDYRGIKVKLPVTIEKSRVRKLALAWGEVGFLEVTGTTGAKGTDVTAVSARAADCAASTTVLETTTVRPGSFWADIYCEDAELGEWMDYTDEYINHGFWDVQYNRTSHKLAFGQGSAIRNAFVDDYRLEYWRIYGCTNKQLEGIKGKHIMKDYASTDYVENVYSDNACAVKTWSEFTEYGRTFSSYTMEKMFGRIFYYDSTAWGECRHRGRTEHHSKTATHFDDTNRHKYRKDSTLSSYGTHNANKYTTFAMKFDATKGFAMIYSKATAAKLSESWTSRTYALEKWIKDEYAAKKCTELEDGMDFATLPISTGVEYSWTPRNKWTPREKCNHLEYISTLTKDPEEKYTEWFSDLYKTNTDSKDETSYESTDGDQYSAADTVHLCPDGQWDATGKSTQSQDEKWGYTARATGQYRGCCKVAYEPYSMRRWRSFKDSTSAPTSLAWATTTSTTTVARNPEDVDTVTINGGGLVMFVLMYYCCCCCCWCGIPCCILFVIIMLLKPAPPPPQPVIMMAPPMMMAPQPMMVAQ